MALEMTFVDRRRLLAASRWPSRSSCWRSACAPSRILEAPPSRYVSYHRNVPTLVQLMLWYFGISSLLPDRLQYWLNDHNGEAIFAHRRPRPVPGRLLQRRPALRPARRARPVRRKPPGRWATAASARLRYVLMPQAIRNALPALVNHSVSLFKNSSLAMAIGVAELTHAVKEVENVSFRTFEVYLIATVAYLVCSLMIMAAGELLMRRAALAGGR